MLTVGQAMRAAHFPDGESKDRTIQMQVRRALNRKRKDVDMDVDPFLTPPVGVATSVAANLSLLTTTSASSSSSSGGGNDGVLFPQPDEVEFEKYVMNSIVPLYPDSDDVPGKRVMIKVDSGPCRLNARLVARLRLLGFYLYPGVPNTTAVSQETDRSYGPFKGQYRNNLANMVDRRLKDGKSVSLQPCLVSIPVFGAVDPEN